MVTCSRVGNYCTGFFSRTGGAKVGGDPLYLSEDNYSDIPQIINHCKNFGGIKQWIFRVI